jgi:hypothetical protein
MLTPLTSAAEFGTGTIKSAFNAQMDGLSMPIRSALPSVISAKPTTPLVFASLVSRDTTSRTEPAFSVPSTMPSPLTQDALPGIGTTKSALPAPRDGLSMLKRPVLL